MRSASFFLLLLGVFLSPGSGALAQAPGPDNVEEADRVPAPVLASPEVDFCTLRLSWVNGEPAGDVEAADVTDYVVYRRIEGGPWRSIGETKSRRFVDDQLEPGKLCAYRVTARAMVGKPAQRVESNFSEAVEGCIAESVAIRYLGGSPLAASVAVRKFIDGQWREKRYTVLTRNDARGFTGEIGKVEKEKLGDTGQFVERDFRTGFVLTAIRREKFKFTRRVAGLPPEECERDRYRLTYEDKSGKEHRLWLADEADEE